MKRYFAAAFFTLYCLAAGAETSRPVALIEVKAPSTETMGMQHSQIVSNDPHVEWILPASVNSQLLNKGTTTAYLFDQQVAIEFKDEPRRKGEFENWWGRATITGDESSRSSDAYNVILYKKPDGSVGGTITLGSSIYQLKTVEGKPSVIKRDARGMDGSPDRPLIEERFPPPLKQSRQSIPSAIQTPSKTPSG